ncbi:uncharacterized protein LACBIDRAFT_302978 [Laccaria bicolor S238N-H82]|uniref:Predicted protein n=1 Tax=Laccaria bicolor (strain S238N-H82 / ATCC MYA-4686) TaxID=486041 RepID=B0DIQ8_LACBS|nr:uncharacterized protein LACBIDRAFT_302978 [Laccaria bicolor S238N-H82]EDR05612.1 predicted protein [Laccaria bicolor S238N-H82]|eukprot:XP_001883716.1 predicted protein [Laccaria bicolor S238N-H82]
MDHSIHHLNPLTTASVRTDPDAIWIGLNSDTSLIPDAAIAFKDLPDPCWSIEDFSDAGHILPIDSARDPDWYREDEQWAAWTPTSSLLKQRPWYDQLETAVPVEERLGGWSMAEHQRQICATDLTRTQSCIRFIVEFDDRFPPRAKVPPFFPLDRLAKVYPTRKMVQISAAKAKRSVLHALAFLSWWTMVIISWEENLADGAVSIITYLLSTVKGKRGIICDLERDWPTINIPLYIQNNIPVFYLWNFEARVDNRFSRLNPALNLTYWAVRQGTALTLSADIEEEDLNKIARQALRLDHFFQEAFTYRSLDDFRISPTYSFFIIDFEGWKRRPIPYDENTITSLLKFYYYNVFDEDGNNDHRTVVFWRWHKREPRDDYLKRQYKVGLSGEEQAGTIREIHKFSYGPKPSISYDIETGLITRKKTPSQNTTSLLLRMNMDETGTNRSLQGRLSDNAQSEMSIDSGSDSSEEDATRFPEVPDILYHPRAVNSPAAWIRRNEELLTSARRHTAELRTARGDNTTPLCRSQSPIRLSDPYFSPHESPEVMFRRLLKDESAKITYTASTWCAPHYAWNSDFLEAAFIFVPDIESEARMRYWANCWDTTATIQRLLTTAVEHGLRFYLALPPDRVRQFRPLVVDSLDRNSASFLYSTGFQEQTLSPMDNGATFCSTYLAKMNDILRRPHARAFIAEGGQISWIARHWAGTRLMEEFMSGPSIQVTIHSRGFYDSASENASYLAHDIVSEQEKDLLLGYCLGSNGCLGRWLFPPADIFDDNFELWTGEWNSALDHIYGRLAEDIARGRAKLRTREKWKCWIRNNVRGQRRPSYLPSRSDFNDVMEGITRTGLEPTWHKKQIDDIVFPERRMD